MYICKEYVSSGFAVVGYVVGNGFTPVQVYKSPGYSFPRLNTHYPGVPAMEVKDAIFSARSLVHYMNGGSSAELERLFAANFGKH